MKIRNLKICNYRTLESIDLAFPSSYAAICGANDSGKTNVIRAIRALAKGESAALPIIFYDEDELSIKDDFPKWNDTDPLKREISFELQMSFDKERDVGFYQFITKQLSIKDARQSLDLCLGVKYRADKAEPSVDVAACGKKDSGLSAQQVLKKLQSSNSILFHNSTQVARAHLLGGRSVAGSVREISGQYEAMVTAMKKTVNRNLAKISKAQQAEFEALLGRLQTKYRVGLSMPAFDFSYLPFSITLGDRKVEVPLDDWGSGTRNRTLILLTLFRARQIGGSEPSAAKITPVIIVEEPESFLHPSAQAEFGRILQDLAEEFEVQVIITTHSPYLLSPRAPESNILLRRRTAYRQLRETERVETTGESWMVPFGEALGLNASEFKPWRNLLSAGSEAILLVEGETDREYFTMLRDPAHGPNKLTFSGDIVSYEGTGSLSNTVLLRFVKNRYRKLFVTFDLDAAAQVEKTLQSLQLVKGKQYAPVGHNAPGKKNIEGLLPESIRTAVYGANPDLVQAATAGTKEEQGDAKKKLKWALLSEFKRAASPGDEHFGRFYSLAKMINRALS